MRLALFVLSNLITCYRRSFPLKKGKPLKTLPHFAFVIAIFCFMPETTSPHFGGNFYENF